MTEPEAKHVAALEARIARALRVADRLRLVFSKTESINAWNVSDAFVTALMTDVKEN